MTETDKKKLVIQDSVWWLAYCWHILTYNGDVKCIYSENYEIKMKKKSLNVDKKLNDKFINRKLNDKSTNNMKENN